MARGLGNIVPPITYYHDPSAGYGHLAIKIPEDLATALFRSLEVTPASLRSSNGLVEYHVLDTSSSSPIALKTFVERYVHSEISKRLSSVDSPVQGHGTAGIPLNIGSDLSRPLIRLVAFLGMESPRRP